MSRQNQSLYDRHITVFSPQGKLFQVEYAFRAVKSSNLTAVAIRGARCACVAIQRRVPNLQQSQTEKLLDMSSVTSLYPVSKQIGAAFIGIPGDARSIVFRARDVVSKFEYENGHEMAPEHLALRVANLNQIYTQHAYMRLRACEGLFIGWDSEIKRPAVYKVDPAGWFAGYHACVIGAKEQEGISVLEKVLKTAKLETTDSVVEETIAALQTIIGTDFKSIDVEVAKICEESPNFQVLEEPEIQAFLQKIAERD